MILSQIAEIISRGLHNGEDDYIRDIVGDGRFRIVKAMDGREFTLDMEKGIVTEFDAGEELYLGRVNKETGMFER